MEISNDLPISVQMDSALSSTFEQSLARCLETGSFLESFYSRFLERSPEVRGKFADTDFERQKKVLESSLYMMARAALGMSEGVEHLKFIAHRHSRRGLDIGPSLYAHWLEALMEAVRDHDFEFDEEVERSWRTLLSACIDVMVDVYRRSQTMPPRRVPPR